MKDVIGWILNHWDVVSSCGLLLLSVVFFLLKKKPTNIVDFTTTFLLNNLPNWITEAECLYGSGHGQEKLSYVLTSAARFFSVNGLDFDLRYQKIVKEGVEKILNTPQKKEVK